jgi:hypothetical protein
MSQWKIHFRYLLTSHIFSTPPTHTLTHHITSHHIQYIAVPHNTFAPSQARAVNHLKSFVIPIRSNAKLGAGPTQIDH